MATQKTVIDILVKKGILNQGQADKAMNEAKRTGMPLEKALEKLGFISEKEIVQLKADSLGVPFIDLSDYLIDSEVINLVPEQTAKKCKAVPLFKIGDTLTVAMVDPLDVSVIDEIRKKSKAGAIETVLSTEEMINRVIDQYYGTIGNAEELIKEAAMDKAQGGVASVEALSEIAEDAPVIKLTNIIIIQAVKDKASDIHIEPEEDKVRIRYRIDGILHEVKNMPKYLQSAIASRVKIMAKLDISETRKPQDGRIQMKMENKDLDLRVSTFPTVYGENIVMRILDKSSVLLGLAELGFSNKDLKDFDKVVRHSNGMILVTGPTGSGKTSTLYAALSMINSIEKNIITIEDPVEYEIPLIRQTQINPKAGLTFATGLRSILRQDPDIVMVGEIRDRETAEIAIQASLTGHLVLSTLHTNDAASALTRLIDMGVEPFLISSSVIAILAQRLVRVICPKCKEKYTPDKEVLKQLNLSENTELYRGKGCKNCKSSGFGGRIGIFELLLINSDIKGMIISKMPANEIKKKAIETGMRILYDDGIEKVKNGVTTVEEILRVTEEA
ncbi:type II secretion system ATPase GspE [Candidatus Omnitrophota bacterium]